MMLDVRKAHTAFITFNVPSYDCKNWFGYFLCRCSRQPLLQGGNYCKKYGLIKLQALQWQN